MPTFALLPPVPTPVYRRGGFTHATFTGTDRDNVLHAVDSRLILHAFQSGYVMRQFPVDSFRSGDAQFGATLLFNSSNALCQTNGITSSMQRVVHPGDMVQRFQAL